MTTPEPIPGMLVTPKLRLVQQLGSGGMGAVWLADHLTLHTQVVVKFVLDKLLWSTEAVARFGREAAAASQVKSPHVVQMLDHGVTDTGLPYIVMERLEGHDLGEHLTPSGLPAREVVPIITQLARALARAHERGVVHRDIKPSNIFLCEMGGGELFVKLLDFGVAKHDASTQPGEETQTGAVLGSPLYMSPEQLMGEKVDFRTDLWSIGIVAFEALTGQRPFGGGTVGALTMQMHSDTRPRPSQKNPALPPAVDDWFFKACARDPAARFAGAKELAAALARALDEDASRGIELEGSGATRDQAALADTAEASSGRVGRVGGAGSGSGARSGRASDARELMSVPSPVAATSAGLATGSLEKENGKREAAWRPILLIAAVVAIGLGIVGTRAISGRKADGDAPPGLSLNATSATIATIAPPPASATQPAVPGDPSPPPAERVSAPPPAVSTSPKPHRPSPSPSGSAALRAPTLPGPAGSIGRPPSPAASAASLTRQSGSDDDIR